MLRIGDVIILYYTLYKNIKSSNYLTIYFWEIIFTLLVHNN
jgi:hypothetical protein